MDALSVVEEVARQTRDDPLLRMISSRKKQCAQKREISSTGIAQALREKAAQDRREAEADREERRQQERAAALQDADAKRSLEEAKANAARERREEIEAARSLHLEKEASRARQARALEDARWLQADFPIALAEKLLKWRGGQSREEVKALETRVLYLVERGRTSRTVTLPHFWTEDARFTNTIGNVAGPDRSLHQARCSKGFEWILYKNMWAQGNPNDATWMLGRLLGRIVPDAAKLFRSRYTPQILMHDNQYVVEKAFVCGVYLLSTWLRKDWFPEGLFAWPPQRKVPQEAASV